MSKPHIRLTQSRNSRGFTLVELMFTVVILAILTTTAVPFYRSFIIGQRIKSTSFDIMSTLIMARSEAIKRNTNVSVTPNGGSWQNGWTVAVGGTTLNQQSALGAGVTVGCYSGGAVACTAMTYQNNGRLSGTAPSIQLSSSDPSIGTRCIGIDLSGRPNSKKGNC